MKIHGKLEYYKTKWKNFNESYKYLYNTQSFVLVFVYDAKNQKFATHQLLNLTDDFHHMNEQR